MMMVRVCLDSVDGETFYTMGTTVVRSKYLLEFLKTYDHEGSSLTLEIYDLSTEDLVTLHDEKAYEYLRNKAGITT